MNSHNVRATGAILINKEGKILLQKRDSDAPSSPGKASPFGGHIEEGESIDQALKRELLEELELDIETNGSKPKLVHVCPSIKSPGMELHVFLITDVDDSELVLHEGEAILKLESWSELADTDKSGVLLSFDPTKVPELS